MVLLTKNSKCHNLFFQIAKNSKMMFILNFGLNQTETVGELHFEILARVGSHVNKNETRGPGALTICLVTC